MRLIIVSNRAPVKIIHSEEGLRFESSSGGLATGLSAYVEGQRKLNSDLEILWIGWPGEAVPEADQPEVAKRLLEEFSIKSVFLDREVIERFYEGFCNKTIWPLFHYFPSYTIYDQTYWDEYQAVNEVFAQAVCEAARPGDIIWVHDYQLLLLPQMLRERLKRVSIGFFLHIPFPSYEVVRLLPSDWRRTLLHGMFGADLIGFHTRDYCAHFLKSAQRILGAEEGLHGVTYQNRMSRVAAFPMGIDYAKYHHGIEGEEARAEAQSIRRNARSTKIVISVDRQDYSKGILKRLEGFEYFLEAYPEWKQHVTVVLIVVPSRDHVEHYQAIKSHIDEMVGKINGSYGTLDWTPIIYQYRSLSFDELIALYNTSDVALVTPLRDGMNLIAKEFIAARTNEKGVLILSEMAGAVDELDQAIIINPNIKEEIAAAIHQALEMPLEQQKSRLEIMQQRVADYTVTVWAEDFLNSLKQVKIDQQTLGVNVLEGRSQSQIVRDFCRAKSRLLFLDYDGTLTPIVADPVDAKPDNQLLEILHALTRIEDTRVVILSGRDKSTLEKWFRGIPVDLSAEHGLLTRERNNNWRVIRPVQNVWKAKLRPILEQAVDRLPGSFIEDKDYSLAFHYRRADPDLASERLKMLIHHFNDVASSMNIHVVHGKKVLELRNAGVDKGVAALDWIAASIEQPEFVMAIGDDTTDEDMFRAMPEGAYSIKVGHHSSHALFHIGGPEEVRNLLLGFIHACEQRGEASRTSGFFSRFHFKKR